MKSAVSFVATLLIATAAHAQTSYEQLSSAARKGYDACSDAAASKPTTEGVRIAMSTCNRRYLSNEKSKKPETTESFAAAMAEGLNESTSTDPLPKDILSMSAEAVGKQVIVRYRLRPDVWGADSPAQRQKLRNLAEDACERFAPFPEFTSGGLSVTYIYSDDKVGRLANIVASQRNCDALEARR